MHHAPANCHSISTSPPHRPWTAPAAAVSRWRHCVDAVARFAACLLPSTATFNALHPGLRVLHSSDRRHQLSCFSVSSLQRPVKSNLVQLLLRPISSICIFVTRLRQSSLFTADTERDAAVGRIENLFSAAPATFLPAAKTTGQWMEGIVGSAAGLLWNVIGSVRSCSFRRLLKKSQNLWFDLSWSFVDQNDLGQVIFHAQCMLRI